CDVSPGSEEKIIAIIPAKAPILVPRTELEKIGIMDGSARAETGSIMMQHRESMSTRCFISS
ncbi:MAG: hypothetical protein RRA35_10440, partial [Desulfomonilia bacterium]|nr:hypothetical protein [Desulfomonilia bacterium]